MTFGKFFFPDWLSSTRIMKLSLAQEGIYIRLLCIAWQEDGYLPSDISELMTMMRGGTERADVQKVLTIFFEKTDRGWCNEKLLQTLREATETSEKQAERVSKRWHPEPEATTERPAPRTDLPAPTRRSPSAPTQEDIDRVNAMASAWNSTLGALGVPKAHGYDTAKVQGAKVAARIRSNPWVFEKFDAILRGAAGKYASMISKGEATFLNFGWVATAPLAKLEALANYEAAKPPMSEPRL